MDKESVFELGNRSWQSKVPALDGSADHIHVERAIRDVVVNYQLRMSAQPSFGTYHELAISRALQDVLAED